MEENRGKNIFNEIFSDSTRETFAALIKGLGEQQKQVAKQLQSLPSNSIKETFAEMKNIEIDEEGIVKTTS